jgi:hypothetical protein
MDDVPQFRFRHELVQYKKTRRSVVPKPAAIFLILGRMTPEVEGVVQRLDRKQRNQVRKGLEMRYEFGVRQYVYFGMSQLHQLSNIGHYVFLEYTETDENDGKHICYTRRFYINSYCIIYILDMDPSEYITGERLQAIADIYLGTVDDFMYNPVIMEQPDKHVILDEIDSPFENPAILFLYPHRLGLFVEKLAWFCNPFTLITHNSDYNLIEDDPDIQFVLESPLLQCWWGQNLCFIHPKMRLLPIGIANSMWEHGRVEYYVDVNRMVGAKYRMAGAKHRRVGDAHRVDSHIKKPHIIYYNFGIQTNPEKRQACAAALSYLGPMLPMVSVKENIVRLANHRYCICPEGNGVDTHRIWEALYLGCVPIVLETPFIRTLVHYMGHMFPIIVVKSWDHVCDLELLSEPNIYLYMPQDLLCLSRYKSLIISGSYIDQ